MISARQLLIYEPPHDKTNKMTVCPAKTQISLGIRPVCAPKLSSCRQRTLIRLGGCPGWSESSLGAQSLLLVFSCSGSYANFLCRYIFYDIIYLAHQDYFSPHIRLWYLSHRWPVKVQARLQICAVSTEPSLFAHMKYGSRRRFRPKIRHLGPLDGCACAFEEWVYGGRKVP